MIKRTYILFLRHLDCRLCYCISIQGDYVYKNRVVQLGDYDSNLKKYRMKTKQKEKGSMNVLMKCEQQLFFSLFILSFETNT